jgi:hypothetical protein
MQKFLISNYFLNIINLPNMNRQEIEQNLNEVKKFNLNVPNGHRQQLKAALLEYGFKHRPSVLLWTKDIFKSMQMNFKPTTFVAGALVGAMLLGGVQLLNNSATLAKYNPLATKKALAQAAVKNAMFKAKQLSPEQKAKIEATMKADMNASLEEAYAAKDLTITDEEDMKKEGEAGIKVFTIADTKQAGVAAAGKITASASKGAEVKKYLKYTDPQGRQVALGLDADGVVVFKMVHIQITEGDRLRIENEIKTGGGFGFAPAGTVTFSATGTPQMVPFEGGNVQFKMIGDPANMPGEAGERVEFNTEGGANMEFDRVINLEQAE